ncbi:4-hydroxy-tetrahydrodipicolinate synthase [Buchnera aphidicola (Mollitrichosiphum nigrofasciatum)]|uniref:4-hydroxy-tetrahydrodipicolinate synthase n=1 Tax=Buchnera aphidicola TaxID=9 RepID=UPI0031B80578
MFKGSIAALITPMDIKGNICLKSLKKIVHYHIKNCTKAIVAVGTTGESSTLNQKEHINVVMHALEISNGKIPIIAGTGSNSTIESISLTQKFEKSGVAACLTVTPYYNRPTQKGLYHHFKTIAENTKLPQILYNVPSRTGCDLLPATIIKLSHIKNIIGIKEATGDLSRIQKIKKHTPKNFLLISGDDNTALKFMILGGNGVISVTANIAAKKMSEICLLAHKKNFYLANIINKKLLKLHKNLFKEPNPSPIKWLARKYKIINHDKLRLPMISISKKNKKNLLKIIKNG